MTDKELLYHFPYRIEKENNLRNWIDNSNGYYDLVLGKLDTKYENGKLIHFRHDNHFTEKEKVANYLKFSNFINWKKWFSGGRNIFSFSKEILEMLNHTDVNNISSNSIKLPYSTFYLSLKPLEIYIDGETNDLLEGVFISENLHFDNGHKRLEFQFAGSFEKTYKKYDKPGLPNVYKGNFWDFDLDFDKDREIETIQESLKDEIEMWEFEIFQDDETEIKSKTVIDNRLDFYGKKVNFSNRIIKLVINCLLYLSLPQENQDIEQKYPEKLPHNFNKKLSLAKNEREVKKIQKRIEETGFSCIKYVGKKYQHDYQNLTDKTTSSHWRRGHWRNQPYGKDLIQKKLIWIHPTIVNQGNGNPQKGHIYEIEK